MTITQATFKKLQPQISENVAEELILDSYVMHRHHQECMKCECGEEFSTMFEVWVHPTKTRYNGYRQLKRVVLPFKEDLDVSVIDLPKQKIPLCTECVELHEPHGRATVFPPCSAERWAETLQRKYTPEPQTAKAKSEPSLEQL